MDAERKAILVVSFGTSFPKTRTKTIDQIEADIAAAFPEYKLYRAWTSQIIIAKLLRRDGIKIPTVKEALKQMNADGITQVIVQPTYLAGGAENDQMKADVQAYGTDFKSIAFGEPLLTTAEDQKQAIEAVMEGFKDLKKDQALVFMGHGTTHYANSVYTALDYMLKDLGYTNVFLGTVKASPSLDTLLKKIGELHPKKVLLAPFLVAAGYHAIHDMFGENEDSWRSCFEAAGFQVECVMKGIGEYAGIRKLYVKHAKAAETAIKSNKASS